MGYDQQVAALTPGPVAGAAPGGGPAENQGQAPMTKAPAKRNMIAELDAAMKSPSYIKKVKTGPGVGPTKGPNKSTPNRPPLEYLKERTQEPGSSDPDQERMTIQDYSWVGFWVQTIDDTPNHDPSLGPVDDAAKDIVHAGKRGMVVGEQGELLELELQETDRKTGKLERVVVSRAAAALIPNGSAENAFTENEKDRAARLAKGEEDPTDKQVVKDLGAVKDFAELQTTTGRVLEKLLPHQGSGVKLTLRVNIPVGAGKLYFTFTGEADFDNRIDDNQYRLRAEVGLGFSRTIDAWICEAFIEVGAFGWIEASGDTGAETMRLFALPIASGLRRVSSRAADAVFDPQRGKRRTTYEEETKKRMDREDYVDGGIGVHLAAGVGDGGDDGHAATASAKGAGGYRLVGRGKKGETKGPDKEGGADGYGVYYGELGVNVPVKGLALEGKLKGFWSQGRGPSGFTVSLAGKVELELADLLNPEKPGGLCALMGDWAIGVTEALGTGMAKWLKQLGVGVSGDDKALFEKSFAVATRPMIAAAVLTSLEGSAKEMGAFIDKLDALGIGGKMSYELGAEYDRKPQGHALSLDLKRLTAVSLGKDPRAGAFYAEVEKATRLIQVKLFNTQSFDPK